MFKKEDNMKKENKIHIAAYSVLGIIIVVLAIMWCRCAMSKNKLNTSLQILMTGRFLSLPIT